MFGDSIKGIDHLSEHLSVASFSITGTGEGQTMRNGRIAHRPMVPARWTTDLNVRVRWEVIDWKDERRVNHETVVYIDPYHRPGQVWVHFLADDTVRVVVSNSAPGEAEYPGPQDRIPKKQPWRDYPKSTAVLRRNAASWGEAKSG